MIRNLLIVGASGLALAIVGIGGSLALGGSDLARHSWTWVIDDNSDGVRVTRDTLPAPVTRQIAWAESTRLAIDLPGDVVIIQDSNAPGISVTGNADLAERVVLVDGRLTLDSADRRGNGKSYVVLDKQGLRSIDNGRDLKITIRAPSLNTFELFGNSDVEIRGYNQPELNLTLTGNADVEVIGTADKLTVDASGNSSAELDELLGRDATIRTSGNAGVKTAANGKVVIVASGESRVRLTRRPSELQQQLSQDAEVRQD
ncbi:MULTISPECIES: GIN domain-containing protein [unclassified Brevundimonas]|uniref:GIN domain-containing protein n=1 Tax=unclassified Brevundimonas TaxID=2622653 RepID=UPI0025C4109F|nr:MULTISPECIES: DUF2807 domain-containing protein [unclassified Brevundimonas]